MMQPFLKMTSYTNGDLRGISFRTNGDLREICLYMNGDLRYNTFQEVI